MQLAYNYEPWSGKLSQWDIWLAKQVAIDAPFAWRDKDRILSMYADDWNFERAFYNEVERVKVQKLKGDSNA